MQSIDWREAAQTMDPYKALTDLGFKHNPKKGLLGSSRSQTFERDEERITVYPNAGSKAIFIDHRTDKKGDVIEFLKWQYNNDLREVSRFIKDHFNGMAPVQSDNKLVKKTSEQLDQKPDDKTIAEVQSKGLKEKYGLKNSLNNPEYLQSRGLNLNTIFRPEFFKQALNSLGWNSKEEKTINVNNTVFPMRNDYGLTTMIIRNGSFKGFPSGERRDAVWLSNPPLTLNRDIKIGEGDKQIILPKGTEGTLIPQAEKLGQYQFYFLDPNKKDKELSYNKIDVSGKALSQLTTALNPLTINRLVLTESPIDAMSFHQLSPPKPGETRMYLSTGGQPSDKQTAYINQLVQRIQPDQVVLANDNEKNGVRFNINLMGAIQHPAIAAQSKFMVRLVEVSPRKEENKMAESVDKKPQPGEYHLKIFGAKEPKQMEEIADRIKDSINRLSPKDQEPPACVTFINGSKGTGTEVTVAFPKNDNFLEKAQKELEKIINEGAPAQVMKVVKPQNKDFNEDLQESKQEGKKIKYDLGDVPSYIKTGAKNLLQQVSAYSNNAFDALFGGIPGSLPRMTDTPTSDKSKDVTEKKRETTPTKEQKKEGSKGQSPATIAPISELSENKPGLHNSQDTKHKTNHQQNHSTHKDTHINAQDSVKQHKKPGQRMKM